MNPFEHCSEPVAGIDLSLNCPAIVVIPPTSEPSFVIPFTYCRAYYLTNKNKYAVNEGNISGEVFGTWANDAERYETIAEWVIRILQGEDIKHVAIEDYAYSKHRSLTALAENMGILKYFLHKHDITYDLYTPTSIKRCATNKGNADKSAMKDAFYQDNPDYDIAKVFNRKPTDKPVSPINDIVDAYYLALSGRVANGVQNRDYEKGKKDVRRPKSNND